MITLIPVVMVAMKTHTAKARTRFYGEFICGTIEYYKVILPYLGILNKVNSPELVLRICRLGSSWAYGAQALPTASLGCTGKEEVQLANLLIQRDSHVKVRWDIQNT
eukprot:110747-Amorphochlora_amoeboformis.AAC.1